ncbi:proline-rich protein [Cantharellus anzutake]|uniref:proline-rich protein n=1 Tax=Cantharellus anzutake TaxID=1750568 RepID=UPI001906F869|nr:proline-rich protein [Cantharellus anzutake]KAF8331899.1 proline-rich protein [Cantharellus anzutake]
MHSFKYIALGAFFAIMGVTAGPVRFDKRIAQVIDQSTAKWQTACLAAGGGTKCNPVAVAAFGNLLAAADACGQQDAADKMIDLAKTLKSNAKAISLAQVFAQQPRNSPDSVSVPYCQKAPRNKELTGLFQCQFKGVNPTKFVGNVQVGSPGTIPFGHSKPLSPPGSCPAHPQGPIADGSQLVDLTADPGLKNIPALGGKATRRAVSFKKQNGIDAQNQAAKFASLTPGSPCTEGENACVDGKFAQCVNKKFVLTQCGSGLQCVVLPLVNKPGTSVTCSTTADRDARIKTALAS